MAAKGFGAKSIELLGSGNATINSGSNDIVLNPNSKVSVTGNFHTIGQILGYNGSAGTNDQVLVSNSSGQANWSSVTDTNNPIPSSFLQLTDTPPQYVSGDVGKVVAVNNTYSALEFISLPTIGNGTITINQNGSTAGTFTVNQSGNTTISLTDTDTNTQLSTEQVEDIVGAMVSGNIETNISVTYDDSNGKLNFAATDTDTNFYINDVTVLSNPNNYQLRFTYNNGTTFDRSVYPLRVVQGDYALYLYNNLMGTNNGRGPDDLDNYQFMMCHPTTGFRRAVTDVTANFDTSNDQANFKRLSVSNTKNFIIDHPLGELANTPKLRHSCIEGPELTTFYRGKIELVDGTATVNIDTVSRMTEGTFVALNRNIQSFTTNETGWTQVKSSVSGNVLTIIAQDSNCTDTISWMVLGERKDDAAMEDYDENDLYKAEIN